MTDRIKILCSKCNKPFNERAQRLRTGYQVQCPHCMKLITFDSSSEDPNIRRPLKAAQDFRIAAEEAIVLARMAAQAPKRDPVYWETRRREPAGLVARTLKLCLTMILEARDASSFAEIFLAVSGSCDAGRTALFPDLCGRVFADRERLYRIFALIEFASA
jgi:DNA-directed RNA polymerase subunit RPC12/RpoP